MKTFHAKEEFQIIFHGDKPGNNFIKLDQMCAVCESVDLSFIFVFFSLVVTSMRKLIHSQSQKVSETKMQQTYSVSTVVRESDKGDFLPPRETPLCSAVQDKKYDQSPG